MKIVSLEIPDDDIMIGIEAVDVEDFADQINKSSISWKTNKELSSDRSNYCSPKGINNHNILKLSAEQLFSSIVAFSNIAEDKMQGTNASEIELEFGVVCSVDSGKMISMIISSSLDATIKVKVRWDKDKNRFNAQ